VIVLGLGKGAFIAMLDQHLGQDDVVIGIGPCSEHQVEGTSCQKRNLIVDGMEHFKPCQRGSLARIGQKEVRYEPALLSVGV